MQRYNIFLPLNIHLFGVRQAADGFGKGGNQGWIGDALTQAGGPVDPRRAAGPCRTGIGVLCQPILDQRRQVTSYGVAMQFEVCGQLHDSPWFCPAAQPIQYSRASAADAHGGHAGIGWPRHESAFHSSTIVSPSQAGACRPGKHRCRRRAAR